MASGISNMNTAPNQIYQTLSPQQAFTGFSLERESFNPKSDIRKSNNKSKRAKESSILADTNSTSDASNAINEDEVNKKLGKHFTVLRDIKENERLRGELDQVTLSLNLYEEYKKKKKAGKTKIKRKKI